MAVIIPVTDQDSYLILYQYQLARNNEKNVNSNSTLRKHTARLPVKRSDAGCRYIEQLYLLTHTLSNNSPVNGCKKHVDRSFCDESTKIGTNDRYHNKSTGLKSTQCQSKMAAKNPRWPPRSSVLTFPHQTALISRASSRSPCFVLCCFTI